MKPLFGLAWMSAAIAVAAVACGDDASSVTSPEDTDAASDAAISNDDAGGGEGEEGDADTSSDAASDAPVIATIPDEVPGTAPGSSELDADAAFPQDRVPYLRITIRHEDWQAMLDDMTNLAGAFGSNPGGVPGGGPGGMPDGGMPPGIPDGGFPPGGPDGGFPPGGPDGGMPPGGGEGGNDLLAGDPIYVPCTVQTNGQQWEHVGIRFKGNSSLATTWQSGIWKMPLRLKFDEFDDTYPEVADQRFYGFKNISFANGSADSTMLHEKLATNVMGRAGLETPYTAFYRIYVDYGEGLRYFGLYTGVELPKDSPFLKRHFGSKDGNVYKPEGTGATFATWDSSSFEKENNEDAADYSDVQGLYDALHASRTDAAAWRAQLETRLDTGSFLTWLATNTAIQDWDQYGQMSHNYYLYGDPANGGRLVWIPWDHSYAFSSTGRELSLAQTEVTEQWPLIRYLLDDATYAATYRQILQTTVLPLLGTELETEVTTLQAMIRPYTVGQYGEVAGYRFVNSAAEFDAAISGLRAHIASRRAAVTAFVSP